MNSKSKRKEISREFSVLLLEKRKENKQTLKEAANKAGITPSYLNRLERGSRSAPSLPVLIGLAEALNISFEEIVSIATTADPIEIKN